MFFMASDSAALVCNVIAFRHTLVVCEAPGKRMLLDLSFDLVKLRRASGHHSHGKGSVARDKVNIRGAAPDTPSVITLRKNSAAEDLLTCSTSCGRSDDFRQVLTSFHGSRAEEERWRCFAVHIVFRERTTSQDDGRRCGFFLASAGFWCENFACLVIAAATGLGAHTTGQDGLFFGSSYSICTR